MLARLLSYGGEGFERGDLPDAGFALQYDQQREFAQGAVFFVCVAGLDERDVGGG
jgi:hypothetical protein